MQLNAARQVELKVKTSWRDRTTHLAMSPLEFMQQLAALVTRLHPATSSSLLSQPKGSYRAPNQATSRSLSGLSRAGRPSQSRGLVCSGAGLYRPLRGL